MEKSHAGAVGNKGFEMGDYTGYTLGPDSDGTVTTAPVTALSGTVYNPTGTYMSQQWSNNDSTSSFLNAYGNPGTNGSILETSIILAANESFTFNWAFLTTDYTPYEDFSLFCLKDATGGIVFTDGLGQLSPVPEPCTMILFGTGIAGAAGILRKRSKKN